MNNSTDSINPINELIDEIASILKLEKDKKKITPINSIKIVKDILSDDSIIRNKFNIYKEKLKNDEKFEKLYSTVMNPKFKEQIILGNNHYDNHLLNIFFILNNPYLFHLEIFDIIYTNKNELHSIGGIVKTSWNYILKSHLRNFFNSTLIDKWIKTTDFKMLKKEDIGKNEKIKNIDETYKKYSEIFTIFNEVNLEIRTFIKKILQKQITTTQHPGSTNLKSEYYLFFQKSYTGLTLSNKNLLQLTNFAYKELDRLCEEMKKIVNNLYAETKDMTFIELITFLQTSEKFKYKSVEDYIDSHKDIMIKMEEFFIKSKGITQYIKPELTILNDANLGGAYWAYDTFYLNTASWKDINNYQAKVLTLHEGIPGHHTQVSYQVHSEPDGYDILYEWFGTTSGFHEGWALFTEKLSPSYTDMERVGQIQYEMLRTIRIIVDISIHAGGINLIEIKKFMKKYLAVPESSIESEMYRYVVLPGQALGYKIGETIFKYIHNNILQLTSYLSDKSIEFYKETIYSKSMPLDLLLEKYNLTLEQVLN